MPKPPIRAQQLADAIADEIRKRTIPPGSWLPSERQLVETHKVGRSTAKQAIQMLVERGLVQMTPGAGAQVVERSEASEAGDPAGADIRTELRAIRQQLGEIASRLTAIEEHTGTKSLGE